MPDKRGSSESELLLAEEQHLSRLEEDEESENSEDYWPSLLDSFKDEVEDVEVDEDLEGEIPDIPLFVGQNRGYSVKTF